MSSEFEMAMIEELIFFLELQIKQINDDIFIRQTKYVKELVKKFDIDNCKTSKIPMTTNTNLDMDEGEKSTDIHQYSVMVGSLLYLTTSKSDIIFFFIYLYARYQANPKEFHLIILKRILRNIKGTLNLELWYDRQIKLDLIGFTDTNFVDDRLDRRVLV
jgi:hypothetical protein